ncbi:reverse transcriptase domain-containing protein [Tanacetum coccineum]
MRMEQYLTHTDYAIWEVIVNGDAPAIASASAGTEGPIPPKTAEQKLARKNELKAKSTLLLAIPDEHLLMFHGIKDSKTFWEATKARSEGLDKTYDRNISDLDTLSMDNLYNNLKVYEYEIKGQSSLNSQNVAFVSLENTSITNEAVNTAHEVSTASSHGQASFLTYADDVMFSFFANQSNSPQLDNEDLEQIDTNDLEEMDLKWQVAMLTMRVKRFLKKTGRNLNFNGKETIGFDKIKVECYNCHRRGHFARECKALRNQGNRNRDGPRRNAPVDTSTTNALVVQDGIGYQIGLESLEARIVVHEKNEAVYEEDIAFLKYDVQVKDISIKDLKNQLEEALKDKDNLKLKLDKIKESSKNLIKLINSQINAKDKDGLGYDSQMNESEVVHSVFNSRESDIDNSPVNDRFKTDDSVYKTKVSETETSISQTSKDIVEKPKTVRPSALIIEDWDTDSDNDSVFRPKSDQTKPKFTKINFVKSDENMKSVNKENTHRQVEYPRKNCDFHDKKMVEKPVLNNKGRVTGQRELKAQVKVCTIEIYTILTDENHAPRRNALVDTSTTNALVVQDGIGGYDWSFQAEKGITNFALMAYTSQGSSSSDSEKLPYHLLDPKRSVRNRRRSKQRVELFALEETPVVTMADQRTMAELLRAPTEGYAEAIVVPPILAEHFELKHSLINLVTSKQFFGFEKEDPHAHIRYFNKITSTLKYKDVPETSIKLMLFPFSIDGPARIWLDKEPSRSILTWDDLVSKFINHFFPPSKTTNLRNEISNFHQKFEETFSEAWDRFKDLLRACPHHGFTELHQLDTFYNGLNPTDQDSLNSAAGGNLLERMPQDALKIIENKSKVHNSRNKPIVSQVNTSEFNSSEMAKLTDAVTQQTSAVTSAMTAMMKQLQATTAPASVKAVEESCVTCGGAHSYRQCPATDGNTFSGYQDNIQGYVSAAAMNNNYNQGYRPQGDPLPANDAIMKNMQTQMTSLTNSNIELKSMFGQFMKMNTASSSGSGSLPSNTVPNPREDLKAITTQSGVTLAGPSVLLPPSSFKEPNPHQPPIPYPSRLNKEKLQGKDDIQIHSFLQMFKKIHFNISFSEALAHMPKFEKMVKDLFMNKEKLLEIANTLVNENCSTVILKKLPEKLRDTGRFFSFHVNSTGSTDFVVVDYEVDPRVPLLLGRPFLRTAHALVDVHDEKLTLPTHSLSPRELIPSGIDDGTYDSEGDILFLERLLNDDPTPDLPPIPHPVCLINDTEKIKSSIDDPPDLELKDLPSHLEYAFLEGTSKLPVIIAKNLKREEKEQLLKILMEDDFKPAVQHQRRVNPKIHEVIKAEVIKLLDAGLIYPISDSSWTRKRPLSPSLWNICLSTNAFWPLQCSWDIPNVYDGDFPRYD